MKRLDIISQAEEFECSKEYIDALGDVLNHFEERFNEIKRLLTIENVGDLDQISEAFYVAEKESDDLY